MDVVFRMSAIFFFLWLLMRALGKRELSEMTPFELLLLVTMGDLVQQGVTQEDFSVTGAVLAVSTLAFWTLLWSMLTHKWPKTEKVLNGEPVLVVRDGRPLQRVLDLERLTTSEVMEAARGQGIRDLADVHLAVLEPDGKFSFIKTNGEQHQPMAKHTG